jgi:copper chaperone
MIELNVPNITCQECANTIKRAVKGVDEGASCEVDVDAKRVRLDSPYPVMDFVEALEEVGYTALVPEIRM